MAVTFREITDDNRAAVLAVRLAAGQERFVDPVADALREAAEYPQAKPCTGRSTRTASRSAS